MFLHVAEAEGSFVKIHLTYLAFDCLFLFVHRFGQGLRDYGACVWSQVDSLRAPNVGPIKLDEADAAILPGYELFDRTQRDPSSLGFWEDGFKVAY